MSLIAMHGIRKGDKIDPSMFIYICEQQQQQRQQHLSEPFIFDIENSSKVAFICHFCGKSISNAVYQPELNVISVDKRRGVDSSMLNRPDYFTCLSVNHLNRPCRLYRGNGREAKGMHCEAIYCTERCRDEDDSQNGHYILCCNNNDSNNNRSVVDDNNDSSNRLCKQLFRHILRNKGSNISGGINDCSSLALKAIARCIGSSIHRFNIAVQQHHKDSSSRKRARCDVEDGDCIISFSDLHREELLKNIFLEEVDAFFQQFPVDRQAVLRHYQEHEEECYLLCERFSMFSALLRFERLEIIAQHIQQLPGTKTDDVAQAESMPEPDAKRVADILWEVFDWNCWLLVHASCERYRMNLTIANPLAALARDLPSLSTHALRCQQLKLLFHPFVQQVTSSLARFEELDNLQKERAMVRLAQAAALSTPLSNDGGGFVGEVNGNPFLPYAIRADVLCPLAPLIPHSCLPSAMFEIEHHDQNNNNCNRSRSSRGRQWSVSLVALHDIEPGDAITTNWLDIDSDYRTNNIYPSTASSTSASTSEGHDDRQRRLSLVHRIPLGQPRNRREEVTEGERRGLARDCSLHAVCSCLRCFVENLIAPLARLALPVHREAVQSFYRDRGPLPLKRLADLAMVEGLVHVAQLLYDMLLLPSSFSKSIVNLLSEVVMTVGAIHLDRGNVLQAHGTWRQGFQQLQTIMHTSDEEEEQGTVRGSGRGSGLNIKKNRLAWKILTEQLEKVEAYRHVVLTRSTETVSQQRLLSTSSSCSIDTNNSCNVRTIRLDNCRDQFDSQRFLATSTNNSQQLFLTRRAMLSAEECRRAVQLAEEFAAQSPTGGWTTDRHYSVPTTDIPLHRVPLLLAWFNDLLETRLVPLLAAQFIRGLEQPDTIMMSNIDTCRWHVCVNDAFLVKYHQPTELELELELELEPDVQIQNGRKQRGHQRYLPLHEDQSTHSFTIALNGSEDFSGGGTYFADLKRAIIPEQGQVLSFPGHLVHGGDPIVEGTRYIIAAFMMIEKSASSSSAAVTSDQLTANNDYEAIDAGNGSNGNALTFGDRISSVECQGDAESSLFLFAFELE